MNRKAKKLAIFLLCYSIAIAGAFFFAGYQAAYRHMKRAPSTLVPQTFYATISDVRGGTFSVSGMEVNDVNFRGDFCFSAAEDTKIMWRYTDIPADDLNVGDHISITFTGDILETDPAQIQHVDVIQLLDDQL